LKGEVIVSVNNGLEKLVKDLGSSDSGIRTEAIGDYCRYLMIEGEVEVCDGALKAVAGALINDKSEDVVVAAAEFIAWTAEWTDTRVSPELLNLLVPLLDSERNPIATAYLVRAFGFLPPEKITERHFEAMVGLTAEHVAVEVRREALEAVGHIGMESGVAAIVDAIEAEEAVIRLSAVTALGLAGYCHNVEDVLIDAFNQEKEPCVRAAIIRTFARIGTDKVEDLLKKIIASDGYDLDERVEALKAIPVLYYKDFQPVLVEALLNPTELIRESASLLMIEHKLDLDKNNFGDLLKQKTLDLKDEPNQATLLWALHRWRCALEGRGSLGAMNRRFDDFLVEYAEQSLLADSGALSRRLGPALKKHD
jgi:HEAT repeat protein